MRIPIAPIGPSASVEQHADDDEIEPGAGFLRRVVPARFCFQRSPAVMAADREMPPARMERDVEERVIVPDRLADIVRDGAEPRRIDAPILQFAVFAERTHAMSALA